MAPVIVVTFAVVAAAHVAGAQSRGAQTARADAQRLLDRAVALFEAQNYAAALEQFQQVYVETRQPEVLYNIGITQERLGHRDEALRAFREYLARVPDSPNRAVVEGRIRALEPPSPAPAASPAPSAPPPPVEVRVYRRPLLPAAIVAGVGVISFALAPVFWVLRNDAISNCTANGNMLACPTQADADRAANGRTFTVLTDVALGVGVAAVGAGVLYYLLGGHTEVQHVHASLRVAPAANGLSLGIEGTL